METVARWTKTERGTNVALGLLRVGSDLATRGVLFGAYEAAARTAGIAPLRPVVAWVFGLVAYDFLYYWAHRAHHRVGLLWATHAVHHQARRFDVTVGFRVSVLNGLVLFPMVLPLAFLGVSTSVFAGVTLVHALLMTWLHSEHIPELGFLERVLNTPALHRVHHSRQLEHADRNFGGIFSFWDLVFGTYFAPMPVAEYGVIGASDAVGIVEAHVAPFRDLLESLRR